MSVPPEPVSVDLEWSRPLMLEVAWLNMTAPGSRDGRRAKLVLILTLAGMVALLVLLLFGPYSSRAAIALIGFGLGILTMRLLVSTVHIPAMARRRVDRLLASPMYQGVPRITLSATGVGCEQALSRSSYDWAAIFRVQEGELALHLMVGETLSIPIPDTALPTAIDRAELNRRVALWRAEP